MSADLLRKAATILRERAEAATPGGWIPFGNNIGATVDKCTCSPIHDPYEMHEGWCGLEGPIVQACDADISYIATMHPGVGLALADWLDAAEEHVASYDCEAHCEPDGCGSTRRAFALARLIVGEQP